jgi:hypothetical protein
VSDHQPPADYVAFFTWCTGLVQCDREGSRSLVGSQLTGTTITTRSTSLRKTKANFDGDFPAIEGRRKPPWDF